MSIKLVSLFVCSLLALETVAANSPQAVLAPAADGLTQFDINQFGKTLSSYGNQYMGQFGGLVGGAKGGEAAQQQKFSFDPSSIGGLEFFNGFRKSVTESQFVDGVQKFMSNPSGLVDYVSTTFKLPKDKLNALLGEELLAKDGHPLSKSMKILEKLFVPNECRLKVLCQVGIQLGQFKEHLGKIPPQWFEGSGYYKALSHGLTGQDCLVAYATCKQSDELILANPFASLSLSAGPFEEKKQSVEVLAKKGLSVESLTNGLQSFSKSQQSESFGERVGVEGK